MSIDSKSIDAFVEKAMNVEETIKGIANGTIEPDDVDLQEYGILTKEQEKEEEDRKARRKLELRRVEKERKDKERAQWWKLAQMQQGVRNTSEVSNLEHVKEAESKAEGGVPSSTDLAQRYSADYSRWSEVKYKPDDEATKEEEAQKKKLLDQEQIKIFEHANPEFCTKFERDAERRLECKREVEKAAAALREEGNKFFRAAKFKEAISKYSEALTKAPFQIEVLTNLALVSMKLDAWIDALDYCDRALYIDSSLIKPLFIRYKVHLAMKNNAKAFCDIKKCVEIDPGSDCFIRCENELSEHMRSEVIEAVLKSKRKDDKSIASSPTDGLQQRLPWDDIIFVVQLKKGANGYEEECLKQRHIMDVFMQILDVRFTNAQQRNDKSEWHTSLCDGISKHKLQQCSVACTYFRISGGLSKTLERLSQLLTPPDYAATSPPDIDSFHLSQSKMASCLLDIVSATIKQDFLARKILAETNIFKKVLALFCEENIIPTNQDIASSSMCLFLSSCIDDKQAPAHFFSDKDNFVEALCFKMQLAFESLEKNGGETDPSRSFLTLSQCSGIISMLCHKKKIRRLIPLSRRNPVLYLSRALSCIQKNLRNGIFIKEVREAVLRALLSLSIFEITRPMLHATIDKNDANLNIISNIVSLCLSPQLKSEIDSWELALMTVSNLLTPLNNESESVKCFAEKLDKTHFVDGLVKLCTSTDTTIEIKHRCATIVDRLVCIHSAELSEHGATALWEEFIRLFNRKKLVLVGTKSDSLAAFFIHVAKAISKEVKKISWAHPKCASTIVHLLPTVQTDPTGSITSSTVSLPPIKNYSCDFDVHENAPSRESYNANSLRLMISYIDSDPTNHLPLVVEEGGIERLICMLANSNHPTVTKNAACALARIAKLGSPEMKKRCRDLRGMQILVELGQSGKI